MKKKINVKEFLKDNLDLSTKSITKAAVGVAAFVATTLLINRGLDAMDKKVSTKEA